MIIVKYFVEDNDNSHLIMWKRMNEMSKEENIANMHPFDIISYFVLVTNVYHTYYYMFN